MFQPRRFYILALALLLFRKGILTRYIQWHAIQATFCPESELPYVPKIPQ